MRLSVVNRGICRIMMPFPFVFFFSFVTWLPCCDIIYYWSSSAGYQPWKWNNVNKKWVCGSPLSRDYCLSAPAAYYHLRKTDSSPDRWTESLKQELVFYLTSSSSENPAATPYLEANIFLLTENYRNKLLWESSWAFESRLTHTGCT